MSAEHSELPDALQQNAPWVVTFLMAAWGIALRWMFGRGLKTIDQMSDDVNDIKERLARIEGHLDIRRHWEIDQ